MGRRGGAQRGHPAGAIACAPPAALPLLFLLLLLAPGGRAAGADGRGRGLEAVAEERGQGRELLPGWMGEQERDETEAGHLGDLKAEMEVLSWSPRAFYFRNFLTPEECDHLKALAGGRLTASNVIDNESGTPMPSTIRTSFGAFLSLDEDEVVGRIEDRIARVSFIPKENGEGLQILKYEDGQKYEPHWDYFHDSKNAAREKGGQRLATMLMYLSTPEFGGETVFPNAETKVEGDEWSDCAKKGNAVHPERGSALLFFSQDTDGKLDRTSLHGSCPVIRGTKWSATKWMHVLPFNPAGHPGNRRDGLKVKPPSDRCIDSHDLCDAWADLGECDSNPKYMHAACRRACGDC